jgi:hypothetical protein
MLQKGGTKMRYAALISLFGISLLGADSSSPVTYYKDVLPLLQKNCQSCHRPGQIAPMSFLTYESTRPWAKAMKAAILSRKMPPWFADMSASHSQFLNDRSLKQNDIDTIVKWVDGGAVAGDQKNAPAAIAWPENGWDIKPDFISKGATFTVPAAPKNNVIEWTTIVTPSGFTKDTWITSMQIKADHLPVTHHICVSFLPHTPDVKYNIPYWTDKPRDENGLELARHKGAPSPSTSEVSKLFSRTLGGGGLEACYVPGLAAQDYRLYSAGKLVPANTDIMWRLHYTPNGTQVDDTPEIGYTVAKQEPQRRYISVNLSSPTDADHFAIPPNHPNWESPTAETEFLEDAEMVWMMPHMHLRGKDMAYKLIFPDGREQVILSVPNYDFNWQLGYNIQPIKLPKGTKLICSAHYDNSANNKYNPNPNQTVYYGDMTWEEMMGPFFAITVDKSVNPKKVLRKGTVTTNGA